MLEMNTDRMMLLIATIMFGAVIIAGAVRMYPEILGDAQDLQSEQISYYEEQIAENIEKIGNVE